MNIRKQSTVQTQCLKGIKENLRKIIKEQDLVEHKSLLDEIVLELNLNSQDCSAALLCLLLENENSPVLDEIKNISQKQQSSVASDLRMLWYRLEVGQQHKVTVTLLKQLLVEESGVEERLIGRVNIYEKHTLIQLPNGMPAELLRHLKTVSINEQNLDIKRLKNRPNRRSKKTRNKQKSSGNNNLFREKDQSSGTNKKSHRASF